MNGNHKHGMSKKGQWAPEYKARDRHPLSLNRVTV